MNRYFIVIDYNGQPFFGWQKQPGHSTVQGNIEKALAILLGHSVEVTGAGRTDTGVHAQNYVAHFDSELECLHQDVNLIYKLNCILPHEINVQRIALLHPDAHARFDAVSRTYCYYISTKKDPFNYRLSYRIGNKLNVEVMNLAATCLLNYTDFTSFSKLGTDVKTNLCKIKEAYWQEKPDQLIFTITADRFLRNMVRAIVGTLFDVGFGKITVEDFCRIIEAKDRGMAGSSAPAQGLFLKKIDYPYLV
jgi:tRNA pseudouridine38-40 synthase